ncbi:MAG: 4a-hydroxytetrahydrobiopterin dehydratase [Gammaproteobacteria bacterium]|nr:4a-hydroxytetrahydrobiopterin dehydratase [Gammaproteobacteria bacterium]
MVENWVLRKRPTRLERRIDFDNYEMTRDFLEQAAELSEKEGYYPDINFAKTHVNMTIYARESDDLIDDVKIDFAKKINEFTPANKVREVLHAEYSVEGRQ